MVLKRTILLMLFMASLPFLLVARPFVERLGSNKQKNPELSVHMASDQVVVVTFTDAFDVENLDANPLETTALQWTINGQQPAALYHASAAVDELAKAKDGTYPVETRYKLYLKIDNQFENHKQYAIEGPFGTISFLFDDTAILNESIKVNQVGYHPDSGVRYANLGIFLGDGGSRRIQEDLVYYVLDRSDNVVHTGVIEYRGDETNVSEHTISSGEYVYRLDLADVPSGGPYRIHIPLWGVSHPFSITYEAIDTMAATVLRGLYHQRCGMALESPYTEYTHEACHTKVSITRTPWVDAPAIEVDANVPVIAIAGGHHDAGDFDRRPQHTVVPIMLLSYLEAFPSHFLDGQASFNESSNGLPDVLDEALWAIKLWESLQIKDPKQSDYGMIMAGTETSGHPEYGVDTAETDSRAYGTWDVDPEVTAFGAGMMAHAARLLLGYGQRAQHLEQSALIAWQAIEDEQPTAATLYASLQLYLLNMELGKTEPAQSFHLRFQHEAQVLLLEDGYWPEQYRPGNIRAKLQTFHFSSYLITSHPVDSELADALKNLIFSQAHQGGYMGFDMENALYPVGATKSFGWGAATAQGRYADVHAFAYRLADTEEQRKQQFAILCQYADYALGLNPLGVCFVTGLGSVSPNSPLHLDSYPAKQRGLPPIAGIVVYGPSTERSKAAYQLAVSDTLHPAWEQLPQQRRWADGWSLVNNNEFTIWETMVWNLALYGAINTKPTIDR